MKRIKIVRDEHRFESDIHRIIAVLGTHGYDCTYEQAEELWDRYSASMCAGWMMLPTNDDDLVSCVRGLFDVEAGTDD
jgi:hypothetical protein